MKLSTRVMLAMVSLVLMTAGIIGALTYFNIEDVVLPRALGGIQARARLLALELDAAVRGARADALGFRSAVAVDGMIRAGAAGGTDPGDGTTFALWRDRLAARFVAELAAKPEYLEFRIIGAADDGREILRVDRLGPNGTVRIVPQDELQPKGERDFFQRAIALAPGSVDVSPVSLLQDHGRIVPNVPVLRASAPIHGPDGRPFGAVVINIGLGPIFDHIRQSADGTVYLVNEAGDYLIHPDRTREFGFERGKPQRLQDDFPGLANVLTAAPHEPRLTSDRAGDKFGVAPVSVRLAQGPVVTLVLAWPYAVVMAPATTVRNSSLVAAGIAVLLAFMLAIPLARSLTLPLVDMTRAVEAFGRGEPMAAPVGAQGEIGLLAGAFTRMAADVEQKTSQLQRNAETFDSIMTSMADAMVVVDGRGQTVLANAACKAMFGDPGDPAPPDWQRAFQRFERFHRDEVTPMQREETPVVRAMRGESFDALEIAIRRAGEPGMRHIVASGRPIRGGAGPQGAVIVYRDITQGRDIERQLHQSQKLDAIGQLTGGVAHDFNNILTVITGTIEILSDGVADRPHLSILTRMIDEAATRGAELTRQLLAFARRQALEPRVIDPNALVIEAARLLRPTLGEHIEIESMLEEDVWRTTADPGQLSTALLNLAINARDAMPRGGKLTLETGNVILDEAYAQSNAEVRPGPYALIAVSDTGTGIPAALVEKVFEPFFTTKEVGKGTGLGLSMVYGFVKQTGGHIKVYSEVGHGTTIKIYLPRAEAATDAPAEPALARVPGGNETILVVEDDELVRQYVEAQLASLGYATLIAANATEALRHVEAGAAFDLLFTDVIMPGGMNGKQLADEVARRRPGTPVLYTSGYTENAVVHHGRLDPGVALLNKPYRKRDLAEKIRLALDAAPAKSA